MTNHYPDGWDDLPPRLRMGLEVDLFDYGVAYYEETDDGYKRLNPLNVAPERDPDVGCRSCDVFGASPIEQVMTPATVWDRINTRLGVADE